VLVETDKDVLVPLVQSTLPADFVARIANSPEEAILEAGCAVGGRVSQAIRHTYDSLSSCDAPFGAYAVGHVDLVRTWTVAGTLPAGTQMISLDGELVHLSSDLVLAGHQLTATGQLLSNRRSWQANLPAGTPLFCTHPMFDDTITLQVSAPGMTEGTSPELEQMGLDKDLDPLPGEGAEAFRTRLRILPVGCDPNSLLKIVQKYDITATLLRSWNDTGTGILEGWRCAGPAADLDFFADQARQEGPPLALSTSYQAFFVVRISAAGEPDPQPTPKLKAMCDAINRARAGGVRWWIEMI
jgi:hypothetical protein